MSNLDIEPVKLYSTPKTTKSDLKETMEERTYLIPISQRNRRRARPPTNAIPTTAGGVSGIGQAGIAALPGLGNFEPVVATGSPHPRPDFVEGALATTIDPARLSFSRGFGDATAAPHPTPTAGDGGAGVEGEVGELDDFNSVYETDPAAADGGGGVGVSGGRRFDDAVPEIGHATGVSAGDEGIDPQLLAGGAASVDPNAYIHPAGTYEIGEDEDLGDWGNRIAAENPDGSYHMTHDKWDQFVASQGPAVPHQQSGGGDMDAEPVGDIGSFDLFAPLPGSTAPVHINSGIGSQNHPPVLTAGEMKDAELNEGDEDLLGEIDHGDDSSSPLSEWSPEAVNELGKEVRGEKMDEDQDYGEKESASGERDAPHESMSEDEGEEETGSVMGDAPNVLMNAIESEDEGEEVAEEPGTAYSDDDTPMEDANDEDAWGTPKMASDEQFAKREILPLSKLRRPAPPPARIRTSPTTDTHDFGHTPPPFWHTPPQALPLGYAEDEDDLYGSSRPASPKTVQKSIEQKDAKPAKRPLKIWGSPRSPESVGRFRSETPEETPPKPSDLPALSLDAQTPSPDPQTLSQAGPSAAYRPEPREVTDLRMGLSRCSFSAPLTTFELLMKQMRELRVKQRLLAAVMLLPHFSVLPESRIRDARDCAREASRMASVLNVSLNMKAQCDYYVGYSEATLLKMSGAPFYHFSTSTSTDSRGNSLKIPLDYFKQAQDAQPDFQEGVWAAQWVEYLSKPMSAVGTAPGTSHIKPSLSSPGVGREKQVDPLEQAEKGHSPYKADFDLVL